MKHFYHIVIEREGFLGETELFILLKKCGIVVNDLNYKGFVILSVEEKDLNPVKSVIKCFNGDSKIIRIDQSISSCYGLITSILNSREQISY